MKLQVAFFDALSGAEVYEILKARSTVFMVEQKILCVDMDGVDYDSLHCALWDEGRVVAYLRAFYDPADRTCVRIGRVLSLVHGRGLGRALMEASLPEIVRRLPCRRLALDSQTHAIGFYEKLGFAVTSEEFLEEGVPHVKMERKLPGKGE